MFVGLILLAPFQAKDSAKIVKPLAPVYANAATRNLISSCRRAYQDLKSVIFTVTVDGRKNQYWYENGRMRGIQGNVHWLYQDKTLTLQKAPNTYFGKVRPYGINLWLGKAGASPEMMPVYLLEKRNPVDSLMPPGAKVRKAGSVTLDDQPMDIVEIQGGSLRLSLGIARNSHLIVDLSSKNVDYKGRTVLRSSRKFAWFSPNKSIAPNMFQLGSMSVKPLQAIK